jgi:hypothetical protein
MTDSPAMPEALVQACRREPELKQTLKTLWAAHLHGEGAAAIERLRDDQPDIYLRVMAALFPDKVRADLLHELEGADDAALEMFARYRGAH